MTPTYLDTAGLASRVGLTAGSARTYLSRGKLPPPDVHVGKTPGWTAATVDAWSAGRARLVRPVQSTQPNSSGGPMQLVVDSDASGGIGV